MISAEPLIQSGKDYLAFRAMMPRELAFKDPTTGGHINYVIFCGRQRVLFNRNKKLGETIELVGVRPVEFEEYCETHGAEPNWQGLQNFAYYKYCQEKDVTGG